MPRASSRSSFEARLQLAARLVQHRRQLGQLVGPAARQLELERERDEPRLGAVVEVAFEAPALGVAGLDEPRAGRAQVLYASPQLGRQALVLERQGRGGARGAGEVGLLVQRRVVHDCGDPPALQLHGRPTLLGEPERTAGCVHEALRLGQPIGELDTRIAEPLRERRTQLLLAGRLAQPRDQLGDRRAVGEPRAQQPGKEAERHRCEQEKREPLEPGLGRADRVEALCDDEGQEGRPARPENGAQNGAPRGGQCGAPPVDHHEADDRDQDGREVLESVEQVRQALVRVNHHQV